MEYKLLALDVDGTLLNSKNEITPAVKAAITKAQELGVVVAISTGRGYQSALRMIQEINSGPYAINYGGAQITDVALGKPVSVTSLPQDLLVEAIELARKFNLHIHVYSDDGSFYYDKESEFSRYYSERSELVGNEVGDLLLKEWTTPKALCVGYPKAMETALPYFAEHFKGRLRVSTSNPRYIEINNVDSDKGRALEKLAELLDIKIEETIAVGDDSIDLEMLKAAGLGVCMANGTPAVKAIADYIAPSNDEDGVAHVIEKFILKG